MTDEELDALVHTLWHGEVTLATVASSADAITTLRTQLAEANARADRAEAALAAQIEADASIADYYADQDYCAMGYPEEGGIAASGTADMIRRDIRSQPHDRTALERYRETVLRELAKTVRGWRNDIPTTGEECANAILELIKPEEK